MSPLSLSRLVTQKPRKNIHYNIVIGAKRGAGRDGEVQECYSPVLRAKKREGTVLFRGSKTTKGKQAESRAESSDGTGVWLNIWFSDWQTLI